VKAILPVPMTMVDLEAAVAKEAKVAALLLELAQGAVYDAARAQINQFREDFPDADFTADKFDLAKLDICVLATMERASRAAYVPSEAEMGSFCENYAEIMLAGGYDPKKVTTHTDLFKKGMLKIKSNKVALGKLRDVLTLYVSLVGEDLADFESVYGWVSERLNRWIDAEEKDYSESI